jgi:hypothetical protein
VKRPLLVRHQVSCQAGLHRRYQLETRSERPVNHFCQHGLAFLEAGTGIAAALRVHALMRLKSKFARV